MGKLEELEKKLKAKWKASILLAQKSDKEMTEVIHDVYLDDLELKSIDLQPPVYFFDPEENKKYAKKRNIVLSIFALVESKIDFLIKIKLDRDFPILSTRGSSSTTPAANFILEVLSYYKKVSLLEILYKDNKIHIKLLRNLGTIRNAFAHSLFMGNSKYNFEGRNVVQNLYALEGLLEKAINVSVEFQSMIDKQPEYLEFKEQLGSPNILGK